MDIQKFYGYANLQSLYDELKRRGHTMAKAAGGGKEIERKWLLQPRSTIHELSNDMRIVDILGVSQWYLSIQPEIRHRTVTHISAKTGRVLSSAMEYFLSYKSSDPGLVRTEYEFQIDQMTSQEILENLEKQCICNMSNYCINKITYLLKRDGDPDERCYVLSYVDPNPRSTKLFTADRILRFDPGDYEFAYLEVEFRSEEEANEFTLPPEFQILNPVDVTDDPRYRMANYWKETRDRYSLKKNQPKIEEKALGNTESFTTGASLPIKVSTLRGLVEYYATACPEQEVIVTIKDGILSITPVEKD